MLSHPSVCAKDQLRLGLVGYVTRSSEWRDDGGNAAVSFRL